jgi:glycine cleavage system H protein
MSAKKTCHVVPPDELRCVWMTAGILTYQLCDHQFDCDECPLDGAMRKHVARGTSLPAVESGRPGGATPREKLRADRRYFGNHCWVKQTEDGFLRVGIEPRLGEVFLALKAIVFPAAGQELRRGQRCLWLVMEGGTLPLVSPADGVVHATNHELAEKPYLLTNQPFDQGWLFEIGEESSTLDSLKLMDADQASSSYAADECAFMGALTKSLKGNTASVGITMADGGEPLQNLADMLGPDKYFAIVRKIYG